MKIFSLHPGQFYLKPSVLLRVLHQHRSRSSVFFSTMSKTIYVCEVQGNDSEGIGSEKMPYNSLLKAVESNSGVKEITIMMRKTLLETYQVAAKAAIKKANNKYEDNLKKAEKAKERSAKDAEEDKKRAAITLLRIEESKTVVISQDSSLPVAKKVYIE
jgi:asparaginyl-tRNA synthetase